MQFEGALFFPVLSGYCSLTSIEILLIHLLIDEKVLQFLLLSYCPVKYFIDFPTYLTSFKFKYESIICC